MTENTGDEYSPASPGEEAEFVGEQPDDLVETDDYGDIIEEDGEPEADPTPEGDVPEEDPDGEE